MSTNIDDEIIHTRLENGRCICIRTITEEDRERLRDGIAELSPRSRYLRFFSAAPTAPPNVIDQLIDVDGEDHMAWGAIDMDASNKPAIGAVHVIREKSDPTNYDFSVAVLDPYHREGIGTLLTATVMINCKVNGVENLHAYTLADNQSAISLLSSMGAILISTHSAVREYEVTVSQALERLSAAADADAMQDVFNQLRKYC